MKNGNLALKLIQMLIHSDDVKNEAEDAGHPFIGKYVICRSRNEGVNFGLCVSANEHQVELKKAQRLYWFAPAEKSHSWYEGVAVHGISSDSKISSPCHKLIKEDYSLTLCEPKCIESIQGHQHYEQR